MIENSIDDIIKDIQTLIFECDIYSDRSEIHKKIQYYLLGYFYDKVFKVIPEYRMSYRTLGRVKRLQGQAKESKTGYIDVFIQKNNLKIAVEFDSGRRIKWKSLEKLLESDAQYCFELVWGGIRLSYPIEQTIQDNLSRIKNVLVEIISYYDKIKAFNELNKLISKEFWLGIGKSGFLKKLI